MRSKCNVYIYRVVRPSGTRTLTVVALSPLVHSRSLSLTPTRTQTLSLSLSLSSRSNGSSLSVAARSRRRSLTHTTQSLSLSPLPLTFSNCRGCGSKPFQPNIASFLTRLVKKWRKKCSLTPWGRPCIVSSKQRFKRLHS